jgi:transcriptional regulator with XRE-family HTH domain
MTSLIPRPPRPRFQTRHREFGAFVRDARTARRMTLRACAKAIGLAPGHLSNVENGRAGAPDQAVLATLAEVLEIPVGALLARAGRLGPEHLHRFWESPLIPSLVMSSTGWTQEEAAIFQAMVLASLDTTPRSGGDTSSRAIFGTSGAL